MVKDRPKVEFEAKREKMDERDGRENYEVRITNYKKEEKPGFLLAIRSRAGSARE